MGGSKDTAKTESADSVDIFLRAFLQIKKDKPLQRFCYGCFKDLSSSSQQRVACGKCQIAIFCSSKCQQACSKYHKVSCESYAEIVKKAGAVAQSWSGGQCMNQIRKCFLSPEKAQGPGGLGKCTTILSKLIFRTYVETI